MGDGHSDSIDEIVRRFRGKFYNSYMEPSAHKCPACREPGSIDRRDIEDSLIELGTFAVMFMPGTSISIEYTKDQLHFMFAIGIAAYGYDPKQIRWVIDRAKVAKKELKVGFRKNGEFKGFSLTQILADYGDSFIQEVFSQQKKRKTDQGRYKPAYDSSGQVSPLVTNITRVYYQHRFRLDPIYALANDKNFYNYMRLVHGME